MSARTTAIEELRAWASAAAGLLYPAVCLICAAPGPRLCAGCEQDVQPIRAPFCERCSQPFSGSIHGTFTCAECVEREFAFECAVSCFRSRGVVRDLILRFKYQRQHHLRRALADWLAHTLDDDRIRARPADALVPVPLHPRRQRERGYNQAAALCQLLARRARLPMWPALRRVRHTETQTHFERADRLENLRGAFAANPRIPLRGAHLILVDDVFTTGSTVDECARTLRAAGVASVRVVTVARG